MAVDTLDASRQECKRQFETKSFDSTSSPSTIRKMVATCKKLFSLYSNPLNIASILLRKNPFTHFELIMCLVSHNSKHCEERASLKLIICGIQCAKESFECHRQENDWHLSIQIGSKFFLHNAQQSACMNVEYYQAA